MRMLIWRCATAACLVVVSLTALAKPDCRLIPVSERAKVWMKKDLKEISSADQVTVFNRCDEMRLESGQLQLHYSSVDNASDSAIIGRDAKDVGVPFGQLVQFAKDNDGLTKKIQKLFDGPTRPTFGRSFDSSKCARLLPCGRIMQPENDLHIPIERNTLQSARLVSGAGTDVAGVELIVNELVIRQSALTAGQTYRLVLQTPKGQIEQRFSVADEESNSKATAVIRRDEEQRGAQDSLARKLARLESMREHGFQFEADLLARDIATQHPFLLK
jgi:hypothetical protein